MPSRQEGLIIPFESANRIFPIHAVEDFLHREDFGEVSYGRRRTMRINGVDVLGAEASILNSGSHAFGGMLAGWLWHHQVMTV